jgi:hypothetical protein
MSYRFVDSCRAGAYASIWVYYKEICYDARSHGRKAQSSVQTSTLHYMLNEDRQLRLHMRSNYVFMSINSPKDCESQHVQFYTKTTITNTWQLALSCKETPQAKRKCWHTRTHAHNNTLLVWQILGVSLIINPGDHSV